MVRSDGHQSMTLYLRRTLGDSGRAPVLGSADAAGPVVRPP